VGDVVVWDDRHCFHSTSPIKEAEERYGSGGVVGRRVIQRVGSSTAAAYKWGSTDDDEDEDNEEEDDAEEKKKEEEEKEAAAEKVADAGVTAEAAGETKSR
jgi:hypothetical protein